MKKLIAALWFLAFPALAGNYASPTFNNVTAQGTLNNGAIVPSVGSESALVTFPVTGLPAGSVVLESGYYSAGDGAPQVLYILQNSDCSLNSGAGDGGAQVASSTSGHCWLLTPQAPYNARTWGAKGDFNYTSKTGTDNTTALQNAINFVGTQNNSGAGGTLFIPTGTFMTGTLSILAQIKIDAPTNSAATLILKPGVNGPVFTNNITGYDYGSDGHPGPQIFINNLRISSADGTAASATETSADGIYFTNTGNDCDATLSDVVVYNMPADGVHGLGSTCTVHLVRPTLWGNGASGLATNSTNDWVIESPQIGENLTNGISSEGDTYLYLHNVNAFSNLHYGYTIGGTSTAIIDGHSSLDRNGWAGLNLASDFTGTVNISGNLVFGGNSYAAVNSYPEVFLNGSAGLLIADGMRMLQPYPVNSGNSESYDFKFSGGATTRVFCTNCIFTSGVGNPYNTNSSATLMLLDTDTSTNGWNLSGAFTEKSGIIDGGSTFTLSGCSATSPSGGSHTGTFTSGTTGTCTITVTMGGETSAHGWNCLGLDQSSNSYALHETASTTTTATLSGSTTSGDFIRLSCWAF